MRAHAALPKVLAASLALLAVAAGWRAGPVYAVQVQVESPAVTYDRENNRYTYREARLKLGDLEIFAERVEVLADRGLIRADGFLRLHSGTLFGDARRLELDVEQGEGTLEDATLYESGSGYYVEARRLHVSRNGGMEARGCSFTTCPPGTPGWHIRTSTLTLEPTDTAVAWNATLMAGPVPLFYLPVLAWPTTDERRSGVLAPRLSQETSSLGRLDLGLRLQVPVFLNLGVEHDLTLTPELIRQRGAALGGEYNYAFAPNQRGRLTLWGIKESAPRDPTEENLPAGTSPDAVDRHPLRYTVDWGHNQGFGDTGRLVLGYAHSSDGQVRREYDGVEVVRPYRTYQGSLTAQTGVGSFGATWAQRADYTLESLVADSEAFTDLGQRPQLRPRLTWQVGGQPWDAVALGTALQLSATRFEATEATSGRLYTASPSLSFPLPLGGAFELRPTATRHFVAYRALQEALPGATPTALPDEGFAQSEAEVELRTTLARVFGPAEDGARAYKHRIMPRLIYREREDVAQPLPDQVLRARPALKLVVLRLDTQLLGGSVAEPGAPARNVREVAWLDLVQRYNVLFRDDTLGTSGPPLPTPAETEPGEPLLPFILDGGVNGQGYRLQLNLHYHHQLDRITESTIRLTGAAAARTRLGVAYRYNEFSYFSPDDDRIPRENTFTFNGETAFGDTFSVGFSGRLNLQDAAPPLDRRLDQSLAFVDYHPVCYRVRVSYQEQVNSTIEDSTTRYYMDRRILLTFNLTGLAGGGAEPGSFVLWQQ